jgi:hypothetical protein
MRKLNYQNMVDIVNGAGLLGAGGGGSIKSGLKLVDEIADLNVEPTLVNINEVDDNKKIAMVAGMGAPKKLLESGFNKEGINALELFEKTIGHKLDYLIPVETGAFNTVVPIYTGAVKGLPIVDADGAGRAVPELEMLMFHFNDILPSPFAIADKEKNAAVVYTENSYDCENIARNVIAALGMSGGVASYEMDGKECKNGMIPDTVTIAEGVGATIREAKKNGKDFIKPLIEQFKGYELLQGKIIDMTIETREGFDFGRYTIEGTGSYKGSTLIVDYKNENMLAKKEDKIVAMVPDLICTISLDGQPLTNADLETGLEIAVLGFPCHSKWRKVNGYKVFKHVMEKLGYDGDYKTIEDLNK